MKKKRIKVIKLPELMVSQKPNKAASLIATVALNVKNAGNGAYKANKFLEQPESNLLRIERALCF
jgi:hypothetical protein